MRATILVYGNDSVLVKTRGLILETGGYRVFTAAQFSAAKLILANQQIDVLLLGQSLSDEERRVILGTAHAIRPDAKCVTFGYDGREVAVHGTEVVEKLEGPSTLIRAIGRILESDTPSQT
jgi:DNA-binding NtrC family response regulator